MRPGIYRRRIQTCTEPGRAYALLEDDPHSYRISIGHDGQQVVSISCDSIRTPWATCAEASNNLERLVGVKIQQDAILVREYTDPSQQCTHMFDAAALAIAHAARGIAFRRYDISIECWSFHGPRQARLFCDDQLTLDTVIEDSVFVQPILLRGLSTKHFYRWATEHLSDPEELEAMWLLRRAIYISSNRQADLDECQYAIEVSPGYGACYVYQPGVAETAKRVVGSTKDFTEHIEEMLVWDDVKRPWPH